MFKILHKKYKINWLCARPEKCHRERQRDKQSESRTTVPNQPNKLSTGNLHQHLRRTHKSTHIPTHQPTHSHTHTHNGCALLSAGGRQRWHCLQFSRHFGSLLLLRVVIIVGLVLGCLHIVGRIGRRQQHRLTVAEHNHLGHADADAVAAHNAHGSGANRPLRVVPAAPATVQLQREHYRWVHPTSPSRPGLISVSVSQCPLQF